MSLNKKRSTQLFAEARRYLAGGVNSPVRAFKAVGGQPLFIKRGQGSRIYDVDGNEFIDYVCSWGPLILGHAHPRIIAAIREAAEEGTSFGAPTERETQLARLVNDAMPSMEMVRFVTSGTEAGMSVLRLARGFTGRNKIVKFAGCYHGHSDGLLVKAGSGVTTLGLPDSPGVPASYAENTLIAPYNDLDAVKQLLAAHGEDIAAIILEPVAANMGVVPPQPGFLAGLRRLADSNGSLLIFDEVITGFRVSYGGAQQHYGIRPDLTCLGKIIGGGMPVGAYGGRRKIMEKLAPLGPVYQAGTLAGNPVAMAAGIAMLQALAEPGVYDRLEQLSARLEAGLARAAAASGIPVRMSRVGSLMTAFFTDGDVLDYDSALKADTGRYGRFFNSMLEQGIYLAPSQFEAAFVSLAHSEADIDRTIEAAEKALASV